ncbi:hypothetical protein DNTS_014044 [Danionella cerebrum]|uniref:Scaffolding anchor of CK1 domain-containing protein n=1 Tax=Danionella cerebrum TaxID=2873325 RepID=A0A553NIJ5_9TELE|nr:hypothetical protein DNTS_014044 [Danionella translucida]
MMESELSRLSCSNGGFKSEEYIQPHYKEAYRLAIDCLVKDGELSYEKFLKDESIGHFLSEQEMHHITGTAVQPPNSNHSEEADALKDDTASTGTYWPTHSDIAPPDLDLGWPDVPHRRLETKVELLYHPSRQNSPTIKEVIRKHIQDARQVIAIAMDVFTDVDIFKEVVDASVRGVPVYILLDHHHFKSFLSMTQKQDVQIQKLRLLRVRTVKGQEYCCRSGVKFHGSMSQKFLLVDCQKVFFGSYSFMWSFEKLNLSMVQIITGQLVETYDEEFRTLYARSSIPAEFQTNTLNQTEMIPNGKLLTNSINPFERKDNLRHTLDAVYRQACERKSGFSTLREAEEERLLIPPYSRLLQDTSEFYKRHSYAGERQDSLFLPKLPKYGSSNWNVATESSRYNLDDQYESYTVNPMFRSANMRQSYHGHDKQILNMRQNLPSLANTSKSFLRTWRIESYLNNNTDSPYGDSYDYLDQYEDNKLASQHPRIRSSIVFTSTIPEQPESNSYSNTSGRSIHELGQFQSSMYHPTQWSPTRHDMRRRSLQILENSGMIPNNFCSGREAIYASLNRSKSALGKIEQEDQYKRHSVADPRCNTYNSDLSSAYMYASLPRKQRNSNITKNEILPNFTEAQRSVSHYDFKKADEETHTSRKMWQEPPARTVSASLLDREDNQPEKSNTSSSQHFFKRSTKKIKSLLNLPQKTEGSPKGNNGESLKMGNSTDTILSDYEDKTQGSKKSLGSRKLRRGNEKVSRAENPSPALAGETSAPRFSAEELHPSMNAEIHKTSVIDQKGKKESALTRSEHLPKAPVNRLYSRFEPFCSFDDQTELPPRDKTKSSVLLRQMSDQSTLINQQTPGPDNKFGRFMQRFGSLMHKNK